MRFPGFSGLLRGWYNIRFCGFSRWWCVWLFGQGCFVCGWFGVGVLSLLWFCDFVFLDLVGFGDFWWSLWL